ncbi:hypothetical protein Tco_0751656 [Tanacetum coccineum]|uniref:Remorin C-terminal domain-containing protein n=1 Tax=Tanacetum coccineum TaxID=301880 RepID=A0ABQ4Z5N4_9ASTR
MGKLQSSRPTTLVEDKTVHEERGDNVEKAATTATSLDAEQGSGGSPRCQEAMGDTIAQTRSERVLTWRMKKDAPSFMKFKKFKEESQEDEKIKKIQELYTLQEEGIQIQDRFFSLKRVRLSYNCHCTNCYCWCTVSTAEPSTPPPTTTTFIEDEDLTIAQTLMKMKKASKTTTRPIIPSQQRPIVPPQQQLDPKDKGKGIMQEPKKPVKVKGKDQIEYDADMASNAALIEEWDTIEARIDVDAQLAKRLQAKEREQMHVKERARLLMEFITARKKFFATKRAEEQRKKPPTKAEQRKKMYTYMKHMASYPIQEGLR